LFFSLIVEKVSRDLTSCSLNQINEYNNLKTIITLDMKDLWSYHKLFVSGRLSFFFFSNDHAADNGVKHALTLLAMMATLMMRYRSLSSQILRASFFLTSSFFFVCTTFTMMMMMMMMPDEFSATDGYSTIVWWHILLKRDKRTLRDGVECHCMVSFHICKLSRSGAI